MPLLQPESANSRHIVTGTWFFWGKGINFLFTLILFLCIACQRDPGIDKSLLYGKWDIARAERNGNETPYLRRGFFIIGSDGTITVNISGSDEKGKYVLQHNVIQMEGKKQFVIESLTADTMVIQYEATPQSVFHIYLTHPKDAMQ